MPLENANNIEQILRLGLKLQTGHTAGGEKKCNMQQDILTGFKKIGID